jgi:hypothetical protein
MENTEVLISVAAMESFPLLAGIVMVGNGVDDMRSK